MLRKSLLAVLLLMLSGYSSSQTLSPFTGNGIAPALVLNDLQGNAHSLLDYRGHVVLVNFWATWCPPCVKEMPSMQRLKHRMINKPFTLITVNLGEEPEVIQEFLQKVQIDFTVLTDKNGTVARDWGLFAYPTSFLVNGEGEIKYVRYGEADWDSTETIRVIESLLPVPH